MKLLLRRTLVRSVILLSYYFLATNVKEQRRSETFVHLRVFVIHAFSLNSQIALVKLLHEYFCFSVRRCGIK